ncbi:TRAP transporter large permease [Pseudobacteriovorax antillogorgiicola]|uniref:TRAP transporter, DctM subunit n=1 Tax=Pseudobacteriovorax antillogorgiicola TaxID=1513793 RepID=A0A1Y6B5G4_9BACT|nr:TRAP transporter large permease subunit [Pseudobacteriovorax antillogorgiicola]TCS59126.1 tripartite ATP-independent transporter DctM subunit [Pseudobacteriovorax antillogorgiicola]SME91503.1 TRAP transporter, DctM subunit [Pseudobacteriovorax antillogorgiicola]
MEDYLPLLMFPALLLFLLSGYPVAFVLSGVALLFAALGTYLDIFYWQDLGFIPTRVFGIISNFTLLAVPLFVFMGITLEKSGVAESLLKSISQLFHGFRGSLAIAVVAVGALLAASTGIVGATVVTMGVLSLPTMIQSGYDKRLATGTIAASGTLGQIIPPSIVLVLLGDMMNVDVGDLFAGAIIPGLLLVLFYAFYVLLKSRGQSASSAMSEDTRASWQELLSALAPPLLLVILVLGTILGGLASPTEAASCGATGALIIALWKGKFSWDLIRQVSQETVQTTSMVFMILLGAQFFGVVFRGLHGDELIVDVIDQLALSKYWILFALMLLLFILGFFLDFLEICFIVIPIIMPIMTGLGFDPLWLAILIAVNLQTSFLTPPFGFALFYLKGVAPKDIKTMDIYRGVLPFVGIQMLALVLITVFPQLVLWLPKIVF